MCVLWAGCGEFVPLVFFFGPFLSAFGSCYGIDVTSLGLVGFCWILFRLWPPLSKVSLYYPWQLNLCLQLLSMQSGISFMPGQGKSRDFPLVVNEIMYWVRAKIHSSSLFTSQGIRLCMLSSLRSISKREITASIYKVCFFLVIVLSTKATDLSILLQVDCTSLVMSLQIIFSFFC